MGGNAFRGTQPVTLEECTALVPVLLLELRALGAVRVTPVGSTGKAPVSGDIDVAVEHPQGRDFLAAQFGRLYGREAVRRLGSRQLTVRYPSVDGSKDHQVDIIVGPPGSTGWVQWSHLSPGEASPVKGVVRNLLLNAVARDAWQADGGRRSKLTIDWDVGAYRIIQVETDDDPRRSWRTIAREFVTSDPDALAGHLFGQGYDAASVSTFEGVVAALRATSPRFDGIMEAFADEVRDLAAIRPGLFGDVQETLAYIEKVRRG